MAEKENFDAPEFEPVAAKTPTPGSASRESKRGTFFKTGQPVTNASGAEEVVRLAIDRGLDVTTYRTSFGRMAGTDLCSIYLHPHDKPGTATSIGTRTASPSTSTPSSSSILSSGPSRIRSAS